MSKINKNGEINIQGLKVNTIIGTYAEERHNPQILLIDIKIIFDISEVIKTDKLEDTIDYFELTKSIKEKVESSHFALLEKLADFILKIIMKINKVEKAQVIIHKPQALAKFDAIVSVTANAER